MVLTQEQIDFFHKNGYLVYGPLLSPDEVELFRREYDAEFAKARDSGRYRNLALDDGQSEEAKRTSPLQMLQIMQMCERNIHFRRLIYDSRILDVVQDLIGPNIQLFHDQALYKPARTGGPVFWHQDNGYWKCRPANLVSCWLTLDDVVAENGAMHFIPGSHLAPVWHERSTQTNALLEVGVDESRAVVVELPAGACAFHHCQTLHYTRPNTTDRQRRAFAIHYMTPGTVRGDDAPLPVGFSNPMLRMRM